jgi:hypothetical protein
MNELSYNELKVKCANLGLRARGTKDELIDSLTRYEKGEQSKKVYTAEQENSNLSPDLIVIENPTKENSQILADNEQEAIFLTNWESLKRKLGLIFAGRVQFYLQENSKNNYSIVFKGGARKSECINYTAGEVLILREAIRYVGHVIISPDSGGDTPEEAMKKFAITAKL